MFRLRRTMVDMKYTPVLLFIHIHVCLSGVLQPFDFHCYQSDLCKFPYQFCSSDEYLKRCMPCTNEVCREDTPPLQCSYNCSMRLQEKTGQTEDIADLKEMKTGADSKKHSNNYHVWRIACLVETTILVVCLVVCLAWAFKRWRDSKKTETEPPTHQTEMQQQREGEQPLIDNQENSSVRGELSKSPTIEVQENGSNVYRPTTNLTRFNPSENNADRNR